MVVGERTPIVGHLRGDYSLDGIVERTGEGACRTTAARRLKRLREDDAALERITRESNGSGVSYVHPSEGQDESDRL